MRFFWLCRNLTLIVFVAAVAVEGSFLTPALSAEAQAGPAAAGATAVSGALALPSVLDRSTEARQTIQKGRAAYDALNGYQARMHREIRKKDGRLQMAEMFLRIDKKPATVLLKYTDGPQATLQVLQSEGNFDGKLMTRPPGLFFDFIPIVAMSPDDPRVKSEESRPIQTVGIGHMIEAYSEDWAKAEAKGQAKVLSIMRDEVLVTGPYAEPATKTIRLELLIDSPEEKHPKTVLHFRESDGLPVQIALYAAGSDVPDETYTYYAIVTNPAKDDPAFVSLVDRRLLELYKKI